MSKVVAVFNQFAVELANGPVMFATESAAQAALIAFESGAEHLALAQAYCTAKGLEGKNAVGKINVITDFLGYVAATEVSAEVSDEAPSEF